MSSETLISGARPPTEIMSSRLACCCDLGLTLPVYMFYRPNGSYCCHRYQILSICEWWRKNIGSMCSR